MFATPWTTAQQASLSISNSQSLLKLMSIEWVMPSNHLSICWPLLLLPPIFPIIRLFSSESALCIRWLKYWNFSRKESYDKPRQHSEKQRHYFVNKDSLIKAMVIPVVMYGCESWTTKKAECRRIDAFELRCWRRLLRVPWTARRFNHSFLKETSPEYSLEGLMLKLKFQYFSHLMQRADSLEKSLMMGKIGGKRRRG